MNLHVKLDGCFSAVNPAAILWFNFLVQSQLRDAHWITLPSNFASNSTSELIYTIKILWLVANATNNIQLGCLDTRVTWHINDKNSPNQAWQLLEQSAANVPIDQLCKLQLLLQILREPLNVPCVNMGVNTISDKCSFTSNLTLAVY